MPWRDIPAFVINLPDRPERWAQAQQEFARVDWPVTRVDGVRFVRSPSALSVGHAGCLASHRIRWLEGLSVGQPFAVFEDDVVLSRNFKAIFPAVWAEATQVDKWDVLHLHSTHVRTRVVPNCAHLVEFRGSCWGSHAYIIRPAVCPTLLDMPNDSPVDAQLSGGLIVRRKCVLGVAAQFTTCFQRGDASDIPDTAQLAYWRQQRARYDR